MKFPAFPALLTCLLVACSTPPETSSYGPRFIEAGSMSGGGMPSTFSMSEVRSSSSIEGTRGAAKSSNMRDGATSRAAPEMSKQLRSVYEASELGEVTVTVSIEE